MHVDMDENKEELSFAPSALSDSAGWHEPEFMCDRQCQENISVLRHLSDGGRQRRAAHKKSLQGFTIWCKAKGRSQL